MPRVPHHNAVRTFLDKKKFDAILKRKGYNFFSEFYDVWAERYGMDITYRSFAMLLDNRTSWKLDYAYTISEMLRVDIMDLFYIRKVEESI